MYMHTWWQHSSKLLNSQCLVSGFMRQRENNATTGIFHIPPLWTPMKVETKLIKWYVVFKYTEYQFLLFRKYYKMDDFRILLLCLKNKKLVRNLLV